MFLETAGGSIHYQRFGRGATPVVALHGYGETGQHFAALGSLLAEEYSLLCPDLPLHGETRWTGQPLSPDTLTDLLFALCEKEGFAAGRLTALGYSMGARLLLAAFLQRPGAFGRLVLVAPDGLTVNAWYRFATQTIAGNRLFRYTMTHPGWFFRAAALAEKARLLNESVFKFIHRYLDDPQQRQALYERWTYFRYFRSRPPQVTLLAKNSRLPVQLILGQHDRIIPPALGRRWQARCGDSCQLHIIPAGHRLLQGAAAETVAAIILQPGKS